MSDWESLLLERIKKRDQPSISDLLELYGSCKYSSFHSFLNFPIINFFFNFVQITLLIFNSFLKDTELRKKFISAQLCSSKTSQDKKTTQIDNSNACTKQAQFLQAKLSQLQQELTNSYKNKLNFDDSISKLHEKIDRLENEISEKDKTISKLERTIAHLQANKP
ncbi:uncharacterized protein ELE39_003411 [Cryptosporidium sp. chipmunk genotype I]|uniref:uncharacterized protein n=1 Tax=Cryptosporidium sp. chipmunk genotype I TaxID=1280935 RepID=UPI003519DBF3|nr:hypothetical protein ELE39_003411 [Cryptosporidium sp. chipmunk genotype I]